MENGIEPLSLLLTKTNTFSLSRLPKSAGISPLKLLFARFITFNRRKRDKSRGRSPWKLLLLRSSETRNERFPNCGGMFPRMFKLDTFSALTLWWREPQVTPIQSQTEA
ncbi:hypothetical protein KY290_014426 [Solanum tuberosum]|uniref:Uncharacterized protein n=1 Tax=Solanum tuberosum TaxID=4113 RepID=A0ABQ7VRL2_SOLTU|nr:hypothetical protein KY289_014477 [Solanum tuberosum]KAH0770445.1 hypothetical protein KY290_014426 [Solanum tuberosum]